MPATEWPTFALPHWPGFYSALDSKVALWLEAHNPGQPLNFLDHHIKCGNAIVGFVRREELDKGVPNEAFATIPGDEKEFAAKWRNANKQDRALTHHFCYRWEVVAS